MTGSIDKKEFFNIISRGAGAINGFGPLGN